MIESNYDENNAEFGINVLGEWFENNAQQISGVAS
jgi:hypothetical protein